MTGGAFFAPAPAQDEEYDLDDSGTERHAVQWVGTPGIKGPKWAKVPLLTIGMLGIQCVWSIEMGYASPYLLELGLSKSWMSLVFVAGPLSGLIVQPLIGAYADRCQSRFGRRRPFMVAGVSVCVISMMLLGWSREVGSFFTGVSLTGNSASGNWLAITLAVISIYSIDFSVNALMSTDRALVVDTLPQSQQEEGSAWAGRMFGFGSVAGFFVGNLDLTNIVPFLGKSQLQILSFITSTIITMSHSLTSWAVSERILLRDDRPQSSAGLFTSIKAIWNNIFCLPPGIRSVCIIQFCANIWAADIYKKSVPQGTLDDATWEADAVRSGARALFLQALVNIVTSLGAPFLVSSSGILPPNDNIYASLSNGTDNRNGINHDDMDYDDNEVPNSALWKRSQQIAARRGWLGRLKTISGEWVESIKDGSAWVLPIKWLTLVRLWCFSQIIFAVAMVVSWFVTTPNGVYVVIAMTGFSWALTQWAPYALLGELVLIDTVGSGRHQMSTISTSERDLHRSPAPSPQPFSTAPVPPLSIGEDGVGSQGYGFSNSRSSLHASRTSLHASRTSLGLSRTSTPDDDYDVDDHDGRVLTSGRGMSSPLRGGTGSGRASRSLSPLVVEDNRTTVVLKHSGDDSDDDDIIAMDGAHQLSRGPQSPMSSGFTHDTTTPYQATNLTGSVGEGMNRNNHSTGRSSSGAGTGQSTADKAGLILGIHNVFIVMPQFIITLLSAIIFYLMEPGKSLPATHPNTNPGTAGVNLTSAVAEAAGDVTRDIVVRIVEELSVREGVAVTGTSPDTVGLIFRVGGVAAAVGAFMTYRLGKNWARGRGVI